MTKFGHIETHETTLPMLARLAAAGLSVIVTAAVSIAVVVGLAGGTPVLPS
jgi:hypothetical protein